MDPLQTVCVTKAYWQVMLKVLISNTSASLLDNSGTLASIIGVRWEINLHDTYQKWLGLHGTVKINCLQDRPKKKVSCRQNSKGKNNKNSVSHGQICQLFIYCSSQFSYTGGTMQQIFKPEIIKGVQTSSQRIIHGAKSWFANLSPDTTIVASWFTILNICIWGRHMGTLH